MKMNRDDGEQLIKKDPPPLSAAAQFMRLFGHSMTKEQRDALRKTKIAPLADTHTQATVTKTAP